MAVNFGKFFNGINSLQANSGSNPFLPTATQAQIMKQAANQQAYQLNQAHQAIYQSNIAAFTSTYPTSGFASMSITPDDLIFNKEEKPSLKDYMKRKLKENG